jgi:hypothetical protein
MIRFLSSFVIAGAFLAASNVSMAAGATYGKGAKKCNTRIGETGPYCASKENPGVCCPKGQQWTNNCDPKQQMCAAVVAPAPKKKPGDTCTSDVDCTPFKCIGTGKNKVCS